MKFAAFKGKRKGIMQLGSKAIQIRLRSDVSHCEIVFEPGDKVDHLMPDGTTEPDEEGRLWCYSSVGLERLPSWSNRRAGKLGGSRFKRVNVNSPDWRLTETGKDPVQVALRCKLREGTRYDWQYITGFVFWVINENPTRTACSEECFTVLGFKDSWRFDPASCEVVLKGLLCSS
jgi:hypothetical protein